VVLKIIKHYQEEGQGSEVVQGVLLGLVVDDRLEITNCFPFPQHTEDDADFDEAFISKDAMSSDLSLSLIKPCCFLCLVSTTKSATSQAEGWEGEQMRGTEGREKILL
ncbi:eukaryotic translation initiation factor 3 subunit H, partial [Lates japonicus]